MFPIIHACLALKFVIIDNAFLQDVPVLSETQDQEEMWKENCVMLSLQQKHNYKYTNDHGDFDICLA